MSRPMSTAEAVAMETYKQALEENKELIDMVEEGVLNTMHRLSNDMEQTEMNTYRVFICRIAVEEANQEDNQLQQEQAQKLLDEAKAKLWSEGGNNMGGAEVKEMIFRIATREVTKDAAIRREAARLSNNTTRHRRNSKKLFGNRRDLANFVSRAVYVRLYEMSASFTPL